MRHRILRMLVCVALTWLGAVSVGHAQDATEPQAGPPRIASLEFDPEQPQTGNKLALRIKLAGAIRAEVRWSINDEEVELVDYDGQSDRVALKRPIKAGDNIKVTVTPFDALATEGETVTKNVVCKKAPPQLALQSQDVEGDMYRAKVEASDLDQKPLTLNLDQGPPGMVIDQQGNITWRMKPGTTGSFSVKVSAKDEEGGKTILSYTFQIGRSRQ